MLEICKRRDLDFVLSIRNLPEVMEISNRRRPLTIDELPSLDDPAYVIWIIRKRHRDYGYIIANLEEGARAVISIALSENARGKGLGTSVLIEACSRLFGEHGIVEVMAVVYKGNVASQIAFEKAGFVIGDTIPTPDCRIKYIYTIKAPK